MAVETETETRPEIETEQRQEPKARESLLRPWSVILHNDDDHSFDYVIAMLQQLFGHPREKGLQMAWKVHNEARVIVDTTSRERAELAKTPIPLKACLSVLPCRGGEIFLRKLFEPLGYDVETKGHVLDEKFQDWGDAPYFTVELAQTITLSQLLTHLYVLVPVLDNDKHYWIGEDEVEKLLRHGDPWLASHPEKEQIVRRYLKNRGYLADQALALLECSGMPGVNFSLN